MKSKPPRGWQQMTYHGRRAGCCSTARWPGTGTAMPLPGGTPCCTQTWPHRSGWTDSLGSSHWQGCQGGRRWWLQSEMGDVTSLPGRTWIIQWGEKNKKQTRRATMEKTHINSETHTDFKDLWPALVKYWIKLRTRYLCSFYWHKKFSEPLSKQLSASISLTYTVNP